MNLLITLQKLETSLNETVYYFMESSEGKVCLNEQIGKTLDLEFTGEIYCTHCGRKTKKSYNQGFCFFCSKTAPSADISVVKPELDQSHLGISRDMEWAKENNLIDHFVYLANTGNIKVGITRHTQIPTRWIDQGANEAIRIAKVPYRQLSGLIEVKLKKHFADITNWRKMLSGNYSDIPLLKDSVQKAHRLLKKEFGEYLIDDNITSIQYPIYSFPAKINSLNLEKKAKYSGVLSGIKGQYLIFEDGMVFNVRKHIGFNVKITFR